MSTTVSRMNNIINSTVLIEEIRKRPVLYDTKLAANNGLLKKTSWEEIAKELLDEKWDEFSSEEKDVLIKEIQVKWKSLRDNFTRVLRKEKEDELNGTLSGSKRKKYIYYDQLMFIAPYCNNRSNSRNNPNIIYIDENKDSNDSTMYSEENNPLPPLQFFQVQSNDSMGMPTMMQTTPVKEDESASSNKRIVNILEEVVALQKEDKHDDPMGNKKFLLSLLPFMKKLPDDVNLEVRLQLMSVLQSYSGGKTYM